jgi:hyaluronan synthase
MAALIIAPIVTGQMMLGVYLVYMTLLAYARAFRYFELTGLRANRLDQFLGFAIAPLYGVLHLGLLVWLRLYSLATLRRGNWGTRSNVEVALASGHLPWPDQP